MEKLQLTLLMAVAAVICVIGTVSAAEYRVGERLGWAFPPKTTYYDEWAATKTFHVGDTLVFPYKPVMSVLQVTKKGYESCNQHEVVDYKYHEHKVVLEKPGDYYYISGIGLHCSYGQKLHVKVV